MKDSSSTSGISFLGALAILFIGLKLGGVIHWSWLWVLSPLWSGLALAVLILIFMAGAAVVCAFFK